MFEFLKKIPAGWRLYTLDWSIEDQVFIVLRRNDEERDRWFDLNEELQEIIPLHICGRGVDLESAFYNSVEKAGNAVEV